MTVTPAQPRFVAQILERAATMLRAGDLAQAEPLSRGVLTACPDDVDATHLLGVIAHRRGHSTEALRLIDRTIALGGGSAEVHGNRGTVLCALSRFDEAVQCFDITVATGKASAEIHCNRGLALHELERYDDAIASFTESLRLQPDFTAALAGLAAALCETGEHEAAIAHEARAFAARTDWNSQMDRLVAAGRYQDAVDLLAQAMARAPRTAAPADPPMRRATAPIRRILIDCNHHLMHQADASDIEQACELPVRLANFTTEPPEQLDLRSGTLAIYAHGILAARSGTLRALKRTEPDCTIAAWSFANQISYLANTMLAAAADRMFPAHVTPIDYMARYAAAALGPVVPMALFQWSRPELEYLYRDSRTEARSGALSGHFSLYASAPQRNRLVVEAMRHWPDADLSLRRGWRYHTRSPRDRFLCWRRFKCSVVLPVHGDLAMRFFDALASGQVPIVPRDILDFDRVIPPDVQASLPVVRLERYDFDALRAAHAEAIAAFDRGGEAAAAERQRFVLEQHTLAHRIRDIVAHVAGAPAIC